MKQAKMYYAFHRSLFDHWEHGEIAETWTDQEGNTCIRYESGSWWHYKTTKNGEVEFWQGGLIRPFLTCIDNSPRKDYYKAKQTLFYDIGIFMSSIR